MYLQAGKVLPSGRPGSPDSPNSPFSQAGGLFHTDVKGDYPDYKADPKWRQRRAAGNTPKRARELLKRQFEAEAAARERESDVRYGDEDYYSPEKSRDRRSPSPANYDEEDEDHLNQTRGYEDGSDDDDVEGDGDVEEEDVDDDITHAIPPPTPERWRPGVTVAQRKAMPPPTPGEFPHSPADFWDMKGKEERLAELWERYDLSLIHI